MNVLINIDVPDLEAAIAFYCSALPLRCRRLLDDDVAELEGAAVPLFLLRNDAGSQPTEVAGTWRWYDRHWTPVHLDFVVSDLHQAVERALRAGALQKSGCVEWRNSKCLTFADPFGHGFCLIEFTDGVTYRSHPNGLR